MNLWLAVGLILAGMVFAFVSLGLAVLVGRSIKMQRGDFYEEALIDEAQAEVNREKARVLDPSDPPVWKTYNPRGKPKAVCSCHVRPLEPGERVLWWPIPGSDGMVDLFCTETVQEASR